MHRRPGRVALAYVKTLRTEFGGNRPRHCRALRAIVERPPMAISPRAGRGGSWGAPGPRAGAARDDSHLSCVPVCRREKHGVTGGLASRTVAGRPDGHARVPFLTGLHINLKQ